MEVASDQFEKAKQKAARRISNKVNIPGFRKGKVPYGILVRFVGEEAIVEDAFELLSNEIYRDALTDSGLQPYGPGTFLESKIDPAPAMIFQVPLQPVVDLADYRSVRLEWSPVEVKDEEVDRALKSMQEDYALVEESTHPVQVGDRVTMDIHSSVIEEHTEETGEDEAEHDHDHEGHDHEHDADNAFIHGHDEPIILDADHEPLPGFSDALVGAQAGDEREFDLDIPDNEEEYQDAAGKKVHFNVAVKRIENITLPELNDVLAARVTEGEDSPLTLLELRMRVRKNLEDMTTDRTTDDYVRRVLDIIIEKADIKYPEVAVADEIEEMLEQFDMQLHRQGFTLTDYQNIMRKSKQDMFDEYRAAAENRVRRGLVMREIMNAEGIEATPEEFEGEINLMLKSVSEEQHESMREMLNDPNLRTNILDGLLRRKTTERIMAIGRGEALEPIGAAEPVAEVKTIEDAETVESADE